MNRLESYYWELRYRSLKLLWSIGSYICHQDGRVLVFHHVIDSYVDEYESCKCTVREFEQSLIQLKNDGFDFISINEFEVRVGTKRFSKFALVTFDDVPDNFYFNAFPILIKYNIPFVIFLTCDLIGKQGYLSIEQIKEIQNSGLCTIGAHTITHPVLRHSSAVLNELSKPIEILKILFGQEISYLAYPYGRQSSISKKIQIEAKKCGYSLAFSTIDAPISHISIRNKFFIPRMVINKQEVCE